MNSIEDLPDVFEEEQQDPDLEAGSQLLPKVGQEEYDSVLVPDEPVTPEGAEFKIGRASCRERV